MSVCRCPFLALCQQQGAANGRKRRHKAKVRNRRIRRVMVGEPATSSILPQRPANVALFVLLTGGLPVQNPSDLPRGYRWAVTGWDGRQAPRLDYLGRRGSDQSSTTFTFRAMPCVIPTLLLSTNRIYQRGERTEQPMIATIPPTVHHPLRPNHRRELVGLS